MTDSFFKLVSILIFYFAIGEEMSLLPFPSANFIFFTNLVFPNFYKTMCTNIDLPANFLEMFGSGKNLVDFLSRHI